MTQATKAELWRELKEAGVEFPLHYREYNTEQLQTAVDKLRGKTIDVGPVETPTPDFDSNAMGDAYQALLNEGESSPEPSIPVRSAPDEHAGIRMNTHGDDEPLRVDPETGFIWYRDEVRKSAYPKPRGRRVIKYIDPGVKTVQVTNGQYTEAFEMPGDQNRSAEARITLPSYQVGLYRNPNLPFRIHVYNDAEGYDLKEVEEFYGGPERIPASVKRIYISSELCYDIRSVNLAIDREYRERVLNIRE